MCVAAVQSRLHKLTATATHGGVLLMHLGDFKCSAARCSRPGSHGARGQVATKLQPEHGDIIIACLQKPGTKNIKPVDHSPAG